MNVNNNNLNNGGGDGCVRNSVSSTPATRSAYVPPHLRAAGNACNAQAPVGDGNSSNSYNNFHNPSRLGTSSSSSTPSYPSHPSHSSSSSIGSDGSMLKRNNQKRTEFPPLGGGDSNSSSSSNGRLRGTGGGAGVGSRSGFVKGAARAGGGVGGTSGGSDRWNRLNEDQAVSAPQQQYGGGGHFNNQGGGQQGNNPRALMMNNFNNTNNSTGSSGSYYHGGGGRGGGRGGVQRPTVTGTFWDVRDGRNYVPEDEKDVFSTVKERTQAGINFDSYDNIPVETTGEGANLIEPIDNFRTTAGIHNLIMENVSRVGYSRPTPVQKHSIPTILAGRDLMACAQTGSGKTAAFLFPILANMLRDGPPAPLENHTSSNDYRRPPSLPICLVLAPTRELALQIFQEARKFQYGTGIRTVVVYGGSDVRSQINELDRGCDVCVATPRRLIDLIERKRIRLCMVRYLVLDEADRMLDMGFAPQIREVVEGFDMPSSREGRRTVMFSATFPREIQQLARDFLDRYIYLAVGRVGSTNEFIRQKLQFADEDMKQKYLVKLLKEAEPGLTLIFVETKKKADVIEDFLIEENFPAVSIHGDRSQQDREEALKTFKAGKRPILVATDVAARGLDIPNITHVINCDLPTNIEDYVHRIGRTGRAGNIGLATSLVNDNNQPILRDLLGLLEESNQEIPAWFQELVMRCTNSYKMGGRGGGRGGGGSRYGGAFSSTDIRSGSTLNDGDRVSYTHGKSGTDRHGGGGRSGGGGDRGSWNRFGGAGGGGAGGGGAGGGGGLDDFHRGGDRGGYNHHGKGGGAGFRGGAGGRNSHGDGHHQHDAGAAEHRMGRTPGGFEENPSRGFNDAW